MIDFKEINFGFIDEIIKNDLESDEQLSRVPLL